MSTKWTSKEAIRTRIARRLKRTLGNVDREYGETGQYTNGELLEAATNLTKQASDLTKTRNILEYVEVLSKMKAGDNTAYNNAANQRDTGMYTDQYKEYDEQSVTFPLKGRQHPHTALIFEHRDRLLTAASLLLLEYERLEAMGYDVSNHGFNSLDPEAKQDGDKRDALARKARRKNYMKE